MSWYLGKKLFDEQKKRLGKSQDFNVEEVTSKIIKIDEPKESFSDEKFTKVVLNLLKNIKNNKEVVKLRIIEFISEILPENDKYNW
ncbi:Uncharacterized protein FWK35_00012495 [Aphis craccivora]|uniref:Uncharacterized protein n=1 Tax=Aphis craccivora TaxID=307492 RepID=A0A6G0YM33_APHCR|nr:Uncharacterized protein FWK35_00012495 [Aphis craccivora]